MIALEGATLSGAIGRRGRGATKASRLALGPVSLELGAGAHAFVGPSAEGGPLLLAVLAGAERLRTGRAFVLGEPAEVGGRRELSWVPVAPDLPPALTPIEMLALGGRLRGAVADSPEERLEQFGLSVLGRRRIATLSSRERHSVALVEALTSTATVLLLDEPLGHLDARCAAAIVERIKLRAAEGACVVFATASSRDAAALGASTWMVRGGLCVKKDEARSNDELSQVRGLRVMGPDLGALADALASDPRARVDWEGSDLLVRGDDATAVATAVGERVASSGVVVDLLEPFGSRAGNGRAS